VAKRDHTQLVRFGTIGVINTALDFGLLFLLTYGGVSPILANYLSTAAAFIFSFVANRNYTFKASGEKLRRQLILFFIVTFFGLWVLQPLIIWTVDIIFAGSYLDGWFVLLIGKLAASVVTLSWNYVFYSRIVFKKKNLEGPLN